MKKALSILIAILTAFTVASCSNLFSSSTKGSESTKVSEASTLSGYDINLDNGTIIVTPDQFIADYNAAISNFMETSDDAKAQYLDLIPDFVTSGEDIDINDDLSIAFETSDDGNISQIDLKWYSIGISDRNALNIGFITAILPRFLCADSNFDLTGMIETKMPDKQTDTTANLVYSLGYAYGAYSLYIKPLNFGE